MKLFKYFFSKKTLKGKIIHIEDDLKKIIKPLCKEKFWIERYGAYEINPKNLVFWVCVQTDKTKVSLESKQDLKRKINSLFIKYHYPKEAIEDVFIGFESQENVNRVSDGNWYLHFK